MILDEVIKVLNEKRWMLKSENSRFQFYSPPKELGFDSSYTLPVPINVDAYGFNNAINVASNVLSDIYQKDFNQLITDVKNYLDVLRKDAIYFKLASNEVMFGKTLEINHIWRFLKNINASYTNFLHIDFFKSFKEIYNSEKLHKIINPLIKYSGLRVVDLEYKSFSIGISADNVMGNDKIRYQDVIEWRKKKIRTYKNEVIKINYSEKSEIDNLLEKYNEDERKRIFTPLISSINTREHKIFLTDSSFIAKKELKKLPDSTVQTILPKLDDNEKEQNIEMIQLITTVDKSKKSFTIKTEELGKDLFSQKTTEFYWHLDEISIDEDKLTFKKPITYKVTLDTKEGIFRASHEKLPINAKSSELKHIKSKIENQIIGLYRRYKDALKSNQPIGKDENDLITFFKNNIK